MDIERRRERIIISSRLELRGTANFRNRGTFNMTFLPDGKESIKRMPRLIENNKKETGEDKRKH